MEFKIRAFNTCKHIWIIKDRDAEQYYAWLRYYPDTGKVHGMLCYQSDMTLDELEQFAAYMQRAVNMFKAERQPL